MYPDVSGKTLFINSYTRVPGVCVLHIYDLVPKGVHENRTKGVENKVDDTVKIAVFLECAQC